MVTVKSMGPTDVDQAIKLWSNMPELNYSTRFDTKDRITRFLDRNPGLSTIAKLDELVVGAVLCGHDGRRGFVYHMGVDPSFRMQGIAKKMVERCFEQLRHERIDSCFLFTADSNTSAQRFWKTMGFNYAPNVMYQSRSI